MSRAPGLALLSLVLTASLGIQTGGAEDAIELKDDPISPTLRIQRSPTPPRIERRKRGIRAIDGVGNNSRDETMGAASTMLARMMTPAYPDLMSAMAGPNRLGPREISNLVAAETHTKPNPLGASDFLWQWGQFIDHDIDLTDGTEPPEEAPILIPAGDPWFDPGASGTAIMAFNRSLYDHASGTTPDAPRRQVNEITSWIDASNVYGSDVARAEALRTNDGTGQLLTSPGALLPFNTAGLPNAGGSSPELFLAGDVRANEQLALTAMHTLFVREHNRHARRLAAANPHWSGERIYQKARRLVGAEIQAITYNEFLPALLGRDALPRYGGYDPKVDARIMNEFSTAAFRFGHSALSPVLQRLDEAGNEIPAGHLPLREAFFAPGRLADEDGIDPILRGLAAQRMRRIDTEIVDDVRNFLFGPPGSGGFDLASLNIQRGRDHGLPAYNDARRSLGLEPMKDFADVTSDAALERRLRAAYATVDDIDLWVGGLAEDPVKGGHVGELLRTILIMQFTALRDGDRFWYTRWLTRGEIRLVNNTRLADIIRRNTGIVSLQRNVFAARPRGK
jgi:hypothetical protein